MIFDRPTLAIHLGSSDDSLLFSYVIGFDRTRTVSDTGQVVGPIPKAPLGVKKLGKMTKDASAYTCDSEDEFLEKIWAIWRSYARSRPLCLSLSRGEFTFELFYRAISKDLPERRKAGPNPIADIRSLTNLPGCPLWEKKRRFQEFLPTFWKWKEQLVKTPHPLFPKDPIVITFDVEAWSLFGAHPFSIGGGVFFQGNCVEKWHFTCPPDSARDDHMIEEDENWVRTNVLPHHPEFPSHTTPEDIVEVFRQRFVFWQKECQQNNVTMVTLAGRGFPLETRLLKRARLIQEFFDTRAWAQIFDLKPERDTVAHPLHHPVEDAAFEVEVWQAIRALIES